MSCNITEELIYDYLDGALDELTALLISEHLTECGKCKSTAAQVKQLFFELNKLEKETIHVPEELDSMYDRVYDVCNETKEGFSIKDYINIQKDVLKRQTGFIHFIPGSKLGKTAVRTLSKGAVKASGSLLKQGYKIAFSRG